jgi:hypothetical protein
LLLHSPEEQTHRWYLRESRIDWLVDLARWPLCCQKDRKGDFREVMVERAYGHFWMISDLAKVGKKPTLTSVIPEEDAQAFPFFSNFLVLSTDEAVDIPAYFLKETIVQTIHQHNVHW